MERYKIINKNKEKEYFSIKLHDTKENFDFWIDCSIIDGYGNIENYKTIFLQNMTQFTHLAFGALLLSA